MSSFWDREVVEKQHIAWMAIPQVRLYLNQLIGGGAFVAHRAAGAFSPRPQIRSWPEHRLWFGGARATADRTRLLPQFRCVRRVGVFAKHRSAPGQSRWNG